MSDTVNTGGPAVRPCRTCFKPFWPKPHQVRNSDYQCPPCRQWACRKQVMKDIHFKEKRRERNKLTRVKEYNRTYRQTRVPAFKSAARKKVATELMAGRLVRGLCRACGSKKSEAHHTDYSKPLDIVWLCRRCHALMHAMIAAESTDTGEGKP